MIITGVMSPHSAANLRASTDEALAAETVREFLPAHIAELVSDAMSDALFEARQEARIYHPGVDTDACLTPLDAAIALQEWLQGHIESLRKGEPK